MAIEAQAAEVLGLRARSRGPMSLLGLAAEVEKGLPLSALELVARQVAPDDSAFVFRLVPRATLARRRKAAVAQADRSSRLSPDEGARVARLAEVWALAREVWGSDEEARAFLFRPHPMLDGRRPVDVVLANEFGRPLVEGILGGLQYGSAA
jgi:putative toxin-antitoxin system antitoxin component (TIGR02293 family)